MKFKRHQLRKLIIESILKEADLLNSDKKELEKNLRDEIKNKRSAIKKASSKYANFDDAAIDQSVKQVFKKNLGNKISKKINFANLTSQEKDRIKKYIEFLIKAKGKVKEADRNFDTFINKVGNKESRSSKEQSKELRNKYISKEAGKYNSFVGLSVALSDLRFKDYDNNPLDTEETKWNPKIRSAVSKMLEAVINKKEKINQYAKSKYNTEESILSSEYSTDKLSFRLAKTGNWFKIAQKMFSDIDNFFEKAGKIDDEWEETSTGAYTTTDQYFDKLTWIALDLYEEAIGSDEDLPDSEDELIDGEAPGSEPIATTGNRSMDAGSEDNRSSSNSSSSPSTPGRVKRIYNLIENNPFFPEANVNIEKNGKINKSVIIAASAVIYEFLSEVGDMLSSNNISDFQEASEVLEAVLGGPDKFNFSKTPNANHLESIFSKNNDRLIDFSVGQKATALANIEKDFNNGEGPNNVNGMGVLEDILRGFTAYFSEEDNEGEYESSDVDKSLIGADSLILDKSSVGYTLTALVNILQSLELGYNKNKIDIFKAGKAYFDDESPPMS
jgi:hypothetical protein